MSDSKLPLYSPHPGEIVPPPPYQFEGGRFFCFLVKGDMMKIQRLLDVSLNKPTDFNLNIEPIAPYVSVVFVYYPKAYSVHWSVDDLGILEYRELLFCVNVKVRGTCLRSSNDIYGYIPFLFVDRSPAMVAGREAFGMPKIMANITFPHNTHNKRDHNQEDNAFRCSPIVLQRYAANQTARAKNIFEIACPKGFELNSYKKKTEDIWGEMDQHVYKKLNAESGIGYGMSQNIVRVSIMNNLGLKQYRDFNKPGKAEYKSVIEFYLKNAKINFGGALDYDFKINFPTHQEMLPIQQNLGLSPNVTAAFWFDMDFQFTLGNELWNTRTGRGNLGLLGRGSGLW